MKDYLDPRNAEGMPNLADSAIALDFLLAVKNGVRNYGYAITETASPELRTTLHKQMEAAIDLHGEISELMMNKGWLHPYDINEQIPLDLISAETAVQIAGMTLFPNDTDRLGMFATPNK
ncbi:spore coat protein [Bacillus canaveralius]|uniref:Spore coat protein n=1 Tax=Bacillus canaveralius TaxID=1403243 RepID=A0A2N5GQ77_9BACI|nr:MULTISPECIES: spore coat protein [Bacillus]PLR83101.1 spore coat protein [Bacillus sp. V33-4]PLR85023.1 spore coat protein [Bacillus canaveralius]PLR93284.1 spore coat protein [Bacillus canaveralius]